MVHNVWVTGMTVVAIVTVMTPGGEHGACKRQEESEGQKLLHGEHPSTLELMQQGQRSGHVSRMERSKAAISYQMNLAFWKRNLRLPS